jgi:hypothetical protein
MRSLQREVQSYRDDNENIMKSQEEILQSLNMLQKQVNKYSGTKQEASARQVEVSRSHDRRDDHGGSRQSRSVSRHQHHHSPGNSTRREYAHSRSERIPSMSLSDIRGGDMGQISCKGSSERSSHHHLMERIGREKMQKHGCWE